MTDKRTAWNSTLRPGKPLARTKRLKAVARLKSIGKRKARMKREKQVDGPVCDWARAQPCWLTGRPKPSDPHHVRETGETRRDWNARGECRVLPLNHEVHRDWHDLDSEKFEAKYGFARPTKRELGDMAAVAGECFRRGQG